jgi:hypothetical protein
LDSTKFQKLDDPRLDPEQSRAFIEKAREIEAEEEHSAADKLMERLAKTPKSRKPAGKPSTHIPTNLKR